ncbi:MAG: sulfotransferase domain-containing protein [Pseudomonadales bacterium]
MTESPLSGRRAHTMAELGELHSRTMPREFAEQSMAAYQPRSTDIIISPAGKCGTTMLQQLFHTLRTGGDMEFDDISRVVPWIETAKALDLDINAEQVATPRGFKSHLAWGPMPKGARYIVALRDPKDALVSMYRFMEGWYLEPGTVTLDTFIEAQLGARGHGRDHWAHLVSWWQQRDNPDVLLLSYEHIVADKALAIRRVAEFCDLRLDAGLLERTLHHTSREFMLEHKDRFNDAMMRAISESRGGLPSGSDSAKVRANAGQPRRDELSAERLAEFDAIWQSDVAEHINLPDFAALEADLRRR